ncbi:MAG: ATP-dependent helicase RecG, partial [Frankiales bacterium]|nr:ATP-dependent helicase RecG [Frankiales bacterium]
GQSALLAPTEVLAAQHFRAITALLGPLAERGQLGGADESTRVVLLTGSQTTAQRRAALLAAASGEAGIVVGTHALIQDVVQFAELGLVVVDEQHRFGVHQRDALRAKGRDAAPHLLVMTATPIPRTVAMTVFGDLDVSELRELPAGRSPIQTFVVPSEQPKFLPRMWQRVRDEVAAGRQAYVVCARIGDKPSDEDAPPADDGRTPAAAVLDVLPQLAESELKGLRIDALHGRMTPDDKDAAMQAFARGHLDVLVATTVIEVGVDVPNATVMVVLDSDRFGISQLHQLRGRVGRGTAQGWCFLQTDSSLDTPARERLDAVAATLDGFELARVDLELRREGDVLGASQSGRGSLHFLRLSKDADVIAAARSEATALIEADPTLADHPALAEAIAASFDDDRAEYLERA